MSHRLTVWLGAGILTLSVGAGVVALAPCAVADRDGATSTASTSSGSSNSHPRRAHGTRKHSAEAPRRTVADRRTPSSTHARVTDAEQSSTPDDSPSVESAPKHRHPSARNLAPKRETADASLEADERPADIAVPPRTPNRPTPPAAPDAVPARVTADHEIAASATTSDRRPDVDQSTLAAIATPDEPVTPRAPSLINVVGSIVLNVLIGLIHAADGPPVLPPGSTVTVRTAPLVLPIGSGRAVQADWYFPKDADESTRLVYLQHGFLASGPMYSYTAANLAERTDSIVVAPSLSSNFLDPDAAWVNGSTTIHAVADLFAGDRAALTRSASIAAGHDVMLPDKFVLVGHSAGGTLVTTAAGYMTQNGAIDDLMGVVMLDGVEPAGAHFVTDALAALTGPNDRPVYLISSQRYFWNRGGDMADKLIAARPDRFDGVALDGGLHIDYMEGGNPLIQLGEYLVAGFSRPQNVDAAGLITAGWVNDLFAGTTSQGVYGPPGQVIPLDTPAGSTDAVVLPLGQPARPVWPPLLDGILSAIFDFAGNYLFVYDPLADHEQAVTSRESLAAQ
jgi:hypothetical protein